MKKYRAAYIEWTDSVSDDRAWMQWDDCEQWGAKEHAIRQIGYVIKKTKSYTIMVSRISDNGQVGGVFRIPNGCITLFSYLQPF